MFPMTALQERIAATIIRALELTEYTPQSFPSEAVLFAPEDRGGLGLDSIASLEIISALSNEFDLPFDDPRREDVVSVKALETYIEKALKKAS
jgi:acyl carrier protein